MKAENRMVVAKGEGEGKMELFNGYKVTVIQHE